MSAAGHPVILVVDDSTENIHVLSELLRPEYRVLAAISGEACLRAAAGALKPDLILLGAARPVHVLTTSATVRRIVNMTALTVVGAASK